jgi:hypothetical protein
MGEAPSKVKFSLSSKGDRGGHPEWFFLKRIQRVR